MTCPICEKPWAEHGMAPVPMTDTNLDRLIDEISADADNPAEMRAHLEAEAGRRPGQVCAANSPEFARQLAELAAAQLEDRGDQHP